MSPRNSAEASARTREAIIREAVERGSIDGLEGLTIGKLAGALQMSKAGVIGKFGDKEALQLAALDSAIATFRREVWERAADEPAGIARLQAVGEAWMSYLERDVFRAAAFSPRPRRSSTDDPGACTTPSRTRSTSGDGFSAREARIARDAGDLPNDLEPEQVAFEMNAVAMAVNQARQLREDRESAQPAGERRSLASSARRHLLLAITRPASFPNAAIACSRCGSGVSSSRAWLMPAVELVNIIAAGSAAGHLCCVMKGAARKRAPAARRIEGSGDESLVEGDRRDPPDLLVVELAAALVGRTPRRRLSRPRAFRAERAGLAVAQVDEELGLARLPRWGCRARGEAPRWCPRRPSSRASVSTASAVLAAARPASRRMSMGWSRHARTGP